MEISLTRHIEDRICGALQYFPVCSLEVQDNINGALCGVFVVLFDFEVASNFNLKDLD